MARGLDFGRQPSSSPDLSVACTAPSSRHTPSESPVAETRLQEEDSMTHPNAEFTAMQDPAPPGPDRVVLEQAADTAPVQGRARLVREVER